MNIFEIQRRAQEAQDKAPPAAQPTQDQGTAGTAPDRGRDIEAIHQAAQTFHEQHRPRLDPLYWPEAVKALGAILAEHGSDPLLTGLLEAVYSDLEREYKRLLEGQPGA